MRLFYVWRGLDEWRAESCTIELDDGGVEARGVQIGSGHRLRYELRTDARLITEELLARVHGCWRSLELVRESDGGWRATGNRYLTYGARSTATWHCRRSTNFMPARRLGEEPADHVMACGRPASRCCVPSSATSRPAPAGSATWASTTTSGPSSYSTSTVS